MGKKKDFKTTVHYCVGKYPSKTACGRNPHKINFGIRRRWTRYTSSVNCLGCLIVMEFNGGVL